MAQFSSKQASEAARGGRQLLLLAAVLLLAIVDLCPRGLSFVGSVQVLRQPRLGSQAIAGDGGEKFERIDKLGVEAPAADELPFEGNIKSYSTSRGFGFIQCDETFSEYKVDVFLHQAEVELFLDGRAHPGDKVRFNLELNSQGKPQARNVELLSSDAPAPTVSPSKDFVGRVKGYDADMGYGFIGCEDTHSIFKSDVFLHKMQAEHAGVKNESLVIFTVEVSSKGQPQARNVELVTRRPPRVRGEVYGRRNDVNGDFGDNRGFRKQGRWRDGEDENERFRTRRDPLDDDDGDDRRFRQQKRWQDDDDSDDRRFRREERWQDDDDDDDEFDDINERFRTPRRRQDDDVDDRRWRQVPRARGM